MENLGSATGEVSVQPGDLQSLRGSLDCGGFMGLSQEFVQLLEDRGITDPDAVLSEAAGFADRHLALSEDPEKHFGDGDYFVADTVLVLAEKGLVTGPYSPAERYTREGEENLRNIVTQYLSPADRTRDLQIAKAAHRF